MDSMAFVTHSQLEETGMSNPKFGAEFNAGVWNTWAYRYAACDLCGAREVLVHCDDCDKNVCQETTMCKPCDRCPKCECAECAKEEAR